MTDKTIREQSFEDIQNIIKDVLDNLIKYNSIELLTHLETQMISLKEELREKQREEAERSLSKIGTKFNDTKLFYEATETYNLINEQIIIFDAIMDVVENRISRLEKIK